MLIWLFFFDEWISKGSGFNILFTSVHLMKLQVNHPWCFRRTFFDQGILYLTPFPPISWISDFAWRPSDGKIGDPCLAFSSSYWVVLLNDVSCSDAHPSYHCIFRSFPWKKLTCWNHEVVFPDCSRRNTKVDREGSAKPGLAWFYPSRFRPFQEELKKSAMKSS